MKTLATKLQSVENKLSEKINNIEAKLLDLHNAVKETHITDRLQESTSTEEPKKQFSSFMSLLLLLLLLLSSSGDLQPSTAIANQLPGQLVSTQIRTIWLNYFIFITALIASSTKIAYS